jgi:hypothetical protein
MTPPSPWLSALITKTTYFRVTTMTRLQKKSERMPSTSARLVLTWLSEEKAAGSA